MNDIISLFVSFWFDNVIHTPDNTEIRTREILSEKNLEASILTAKLNYLMRSCLHLALNLTLTLIRLLALLTSSHIKHIKMA